MESLEKVVATAVVAAEKIIRIELLEYNHSSTFILNVSFIVIILYPVGYCNDIYIHIPPTLLYIG